MKYWKHRCLQKNGDFCLNWPNLRERLIRSEKCWWKLPIRLSQICFYWLISRWYKYDMQKILRFSLFPPYCCLKFEIVSKIAKNTYILTLIRPRKIYSKNSKIPEYPFVSPWNLPTWTNLAQSDLWVFQVWAIYVKNLHFSTQWDFPYISYDLYKYCDNMEILGN